MFRSFSQPHLPSHASSSTVAGSTLRRTSSMPRRSTLAVAVASLFALGAAQAQEGAPTPVNTAAPAPVITASQPMETVTVTATRRREPLRDVPLRVETLNAERLEAAGAASLDDYVGGLPGVHVSNDGGPGRGQVNIRGVSVGSAGAPTVGTYVDDVAFGSSTSFVGEAVAALDMSLLDLHHIELLRGPQGTLYGAGAMGGLLKYVTNQPDSSAFSGKASVGIRGTRNGALGHTENAILNVPLSEGVAAMRFAVFNEHDGGYVDSVGRVVGDHVNDGNTRGARLSVLLDPAKDLRVRLTGTHQDIKRNGTGMVQYDTVTGQPLFGDLTHRVSQSEPYTIKTDLLSADVEYDFGWARLNVIGSAQRFKANTVLDASDIVGSPDFSYAELDNDTVLRKQTQEIRLTSARGTIEWLLGYYRTKEVGQRNQRLFAQVAADNSIFDLVRVDQPSRYVENAVYGDITYNPAPAWSFTLGARVARNKQTYGTVTNGVKDFESPADDKSNTYLATARYSIDKVSSVYFRAASGYRPGGPNPPAIDQNGQLIPGAPLSFNADSLWSYEVGYKADLLDKRLYVEAALFDIRWDKLQQPVAIGATTLTTNAGKAESRGLELVARYKLDDHWSLDGALALTDAKLKEDAPALGPSGARLPNTARVSGSFGARYGFEAMGKASYVGMNLRHVGQRNAGFDSATTSVPNFSLAAYTAVDLQAGVDLGAWQVSAFARNVADKRALAGGDTALTAFGGPLRATPIQPRTIGVTVATVF